MAGMGKVNRLDQSQDLIRRSEPTAGQASLVPKDQRATERTVVHSVSPKRNEMKHSSVEFFEEHRIATELNKIVPNVP
jgi:hypothetical protein